MGNFNIFKKKKLKKKKFIQIIIYIKKKNLKKINTDDIGLYIET